MKKLIENKYLDFNNIQSIYGVSVGALIGILTILNIDWNIIADYFINRPWDKLFNITPDMLLNLYINKGIFDKKLLIESTKNLFTRQNISLDITFSQLFEKTNIDFHIFSTRIDNFSIENISHKTHPNMKVLDGIYESISIPYVFTPTFRNNTFYIDGAFVNPFPLDILIEFNENINKDEIFSISLEYEKRKKSNIKDCNILEYSYLLINSMLNKQKIINKNKIKNSLVIPVDTAKIATITDLINKKESRQNFIKLGEKYASVFFNAFDK